MMGDYNSTMEIFRISQNESFFFVLIREYVIGNLYFSIFTEFCIFLVTSYMFTLESFILA